MVNRNRVAFSSISLALLVLFFANLSLKVEARADLIIEGNVLGYNLYSIKSSSNPGLMYPALVKVTKVLEGEEKSQYILLLFGIGDRGFAAENFGLNKTLTFKLKRQTFCDKKINSLMYPGLTLVNGKIVETSQTFTLVPGVDKESLPLKRKIPCYFVSQEN
jgi:hypothetical protein